MSVQFKQKEISTRERLNELDGLPAQVAQNTQALLPLGGYTGRNLFINGDFSVWQRGDTFGASSFAGDRWVPRGSSVNGSRIQTVDGNAVSVSAVSNPAVQQKIENGYLLSNKELTLSFDYKLIEGTPTSVTIYFNNDGGFATGQVVSVDANIDRRITVTIVLNQLLQDDYLCVGIAALSGGAATIQLSNIQLELGSEATPFEIVDPATQLARCQRYFYTIPDAVFATMAGLPRAATIEAAYTEVQFPVTMRIPPAISNNTYQHSDSQSNSVITVDWYREQLLPNNVNGSARLLTADFDAEIY